MSEPVEPIASPLIAAPQVAAGRPRSRLTSLIARGYAAAPIAFSSAVAVHAIVIAGALYYYNVVLPGRAQPAKPAPAPTLAERRPPPVTFQPAPPGGFNANPEVARPLPTDPADEFPPPRIDPGAPTIAADQGTTSTEPLPSFPGAAPAAAPITVREPPPTSPAAPRRSARADARLGRAFPTLAASNASANGSYNKGYAKEPPPCER